MTAIRCASCFGTLEEHDEGCREAPVEVHVPTRDDRDVVTGRRIVDESERRRLLCLSMHAFGAGEELDRALAKLLELAVQRENLRARLTTARVAVERAYDAIQVALDESKA